MLRDIGLHNAYGIAAISRYRLALGDAHCPRPIVYDSSPSDISGVDLGLEQGSSVHGLSIVPPEKVCFSIESAMKGL